MTIEVKEKTKLEQVLEADDRAVFSKGFVLELSTELITDVTIRTLERVKDAASFLDTATHLELVKRIQKSLDFESESLSKK